MVNSTQVFLVDQDLISSMIVKSKLVENAHLNVNTYSTGQECVLNCHLNPDVVVLDFNTKGLHGNDGASTLLEVRRRSPKSKIVLLSNNKNRAAMEQYIADDQVYHVAKGPDFSVRVRNVVNSILTASVAGNVA